MTPPPFIVLGLRRTGTKMLSSAISSHPDLSHVVHEFTGTEQQFWRHPWIMCNYIEDWMIDERITLLHLYREDSVAGAQSMIMLPYIFPDGQFDIPVDEVERAARIRETWDARFREFAVWSFSYESLCNGEEISELPAWFCERFAAELGISIAPLHTHLRKEPKLTPRNQAEIKWLRA